jgi:PAS domain S-box-containing protein
MSTPESVNILMVDDQPGKLLTYRAILEDLGENLISATSGKEALELLLQRDVAIILMDVSMPELDGFELADLIRQHPRFQKTAIIFISAVHLTDIDRVKGYQRGAMDYISVPVVPEVLRAKVTVFADLYRKTRELELLNRELEQRVLARTEQLRESEEHVRRLNEQLQQRVAELETIMKVLPVGVSVAHDPHGHFVTENAALKQLLEPERLESQAPDDNESGHAAYEIYYDGERLPVNELPLQRAAATGKPVGRIELEIRPKSGRVLQTLMSANPLFDDFGNVRGAVGALIDITERKQMEQMLRERADLLDLASEAIVVRDLHGTVLFWNSGATALYGWTAAEALGKNLHQLLNTQFPVPHPEIKTTISEGKRWEGNLVQYAKDGREVVVACRKILQRDGSKPRVVLEICRDITATLQAEEALRRSERLAAMGRMAGIVAHEINNPLESVLNIFYLLQRHSSLDHEAQHYATMAEQELLRVSHITKQTLSFYRESAQAIAVSISGLLDDILELQSRQLQSGGIVVERRYGSGEIVQGFPVELKQVFLNLIANAIQAMPAGGCLRVHIQRSYRAATLTAGVRVSILDTGSGIRADEAKRLFEPFFTTKSTKGTGLGLWICKGIVEKYEGTINFRSMSFSSKNVTCFSVFIPTPAIGENTSIPLLSNVGAATQAMDCNP